MATLAQISAAVPAEPPCFRDKEQWVEYLAVAQEGKPCTRPIQRGEFQRNFNFCLDCTRQYARQMEEERRCNPSFHRAAKS